MKIYKISEFADELGVTAQTLRIWDKKDILKPAMKHDNGWRYYTEEQLEQYRDRVKSNHRKKIGYVNDIDSHSHQMTLIESYAANEDIEIEYCIETSSHYELSELKKVVGQMLDGNIEAVIIERKDVIFSEILTVFLQIAESNDIEIQCLKQ